MNDFLLSSYRFSKLAEIDLANKLLAVNNITKEYGLTLTQNEAQMLVTVGIESIRKNDRVEFGESATVKLIKKFSQSSYISQTIYADTIAELIEVFYQVKNESLDALTDDEVIDTMFDFFEGKSGGSVSLLAERDMDELCRKLRYKCCGIEVDEGETDDDE